MRRTQLFAAGALALASFSAFAADHVVIARNGPGGRHFDPSILTIDVGDTVTFQNDVAGLGFHNVVSDPGAVTAFHCADACGTSPVGNASTNAWSSTVTFPTAGTVGFYCEIHGGPGGSGMSGVITIAAATAPSIDVAPGTVTAATEAGTSTSTTFSIGNSGTAALTWNADVTTTDCATPETLPWLALSPTSGSVDVGDPAADVDVTLDATTLVVGVYNATICIHNNDAAHAIVSVPLEFTVNTPDLIFSNGFEG
jgi:plastocyanin